jgi:23S rRNA (pseudouridine1915-N3)-methyltransferase
MPEWIAQGCREYLKRMPPECAVSIRDISPAKRTKNTLPSRTMKDEGARILGAVPRNNRLVVMDITGEQWSTQQLSDYLAEWMRSGSDVSIAIGGADGLSDEVLKSADDLWSLSALTLPHGLVRIMLAEQLYRAWSLISHHPYHRH